ncbi:hypothetical protein CCHL11_09369 [Colletotrichum chlorophyti]|uniref:Nucleoside phosphorylase domain-containing protein n=1 Tax=Colletotrichum chlorophyti TaxID=708187 RepID=A0A1Q8RPQ4_9PEZI|nr:hypothetical protein CCHL11_09369 [Colletotrichum chlorophyti]
MDSSEINVTIAIICALVREADAVEALFDQTFDDDVTKRRRLSTDANAYTEGMIGRHRVVLVHMAGMGKRNATLAAVSCKSSYPSIEIALVVGVCGGVPFGAGADGSEIVLGDVVVSTGVVAFDFGRQYPDGFIPKSNAMDALPVPPPEIRSFLARLQGRRRRMKLNERILQYLNVVREDLGELADYPGRGEDRLFEGDYRHKHHDPSGCSECNGDKDSICPLARESTCELLGCDPLKLVYRERLQSRNHIGSVADADIIQPTVHFGLVASGDQVMKSGEHRDGIAYKSKVIAFEMEAAGVWESFPCVVIKGVCDYADSHKTKKWQDYAAATAAACMKAFLEEW